MFYIFYELLNDVIAMKVPEDIRDDIPLTDDVIYFDNAASCLTPKPVVEAMNDYYLNYRSNVERGVHKLSQKASRKYEEAREKVGNFLNAEEEEIIFVRNTTEALNMIALGWNWGKDAEIITTGIEHHSNLLPWMNIDEVDLKFVETDNEGLIDLNDLENKISSETEMIAASHISNVLGVKQPVKEIGRIAEENNILFAVDGAQSVGHINVDVQDMKADFLAFSGHKGPLGPTGIGGLYVNSEIIENLNPVYLGGGAISDVRLDEYDLAEIPERYEAGTPNIAGTIGLSAAIDYIKNIGIDKVESQDEKLIKYTLEKFEENGIEYYGPKDPEKHKGLVSFNIEGMEPHDVAAYLDEVSNVMTRSGHHCAIPAIRNVINLEDKGTVRTSYHTYNTTNEIDTMINTLKDLI